MKPRIHCATPILVLAAASLLNGCDRIGQPTETEAGAAKIAKVAAEARALTRRLAGTQDAVGTTLTGEDGATRDIEKPLLGPTAAAEELRSLASRVQSAGTTDVQRKEAAALAQRLRREAVVLDLMALERMATGMQMLTDVIQAELNEAQVISVAAGPRALASAEARVKATRAVLKQFRDQLAVQKSALEVENAKLQTLESAARTATERADAVDAQAQVLRSEAATSAPSVARPKVDAAVAKMNEARVLRREAAEEELQANALRSAVKVARSASASGEEAEQWLTGRLTMAEGAEAAAKSRTQTAARAVEELRTAATGRMEELQKLTTTEFQPLWERVKEALDGNPATKSPTDGAVIGIAKARLYQLGASAVDQAMRLADSQGAPPELSAQLKASRSKLMDQAKGALIEARDSLSGGSSPGAEALLATVQQLGETLGFDLSTPAPAPAAETPAADAPAADAPAPDAPAADAPAAGEPSGDTPPAEPPAPEEPSK